MLKLNNRFSKIKSMTGLNKLFWERGQVNDVLNSTPNEFTFHQWVESETISEYLTLRFQTLTNDKTFCFKRNIKK